VFSFFFRLPFLFCVWGVFSFCWFFFFFGGGGGWGGGGKLEGEIFYYHNLNLDTRHNLNAWNILQVQTNIF